MSVPLDWQWCSSNIEAKFNFKKFKRKLYAPAVFRATDDFTASVVVRQSLRAHVQDCVVRSRSVGRFMDCKDHLMTADELINIREMSERSSVSASTLRYYEKLGLITSERGRSGSHRRYSESTFHRVIYITLAQRAGFSLEEIAEQLAILPNIHPIPPKVWEPLRKKWEQRIDQNIAELKQLKIDLKRCARDASR
jgi:MerR family transcriptional regulator, redox-sensitive transcriptional activator SoxR